MKDWIERHKSTTVRCNLQFEGIHCYPEAPLEVAYLREPHRHIFNVEVEMDVFNDDREIEFIMLGHQIKKYIKSFSHDEHAVVQLGSWSCEKVANAIAGELFNTIPRSGQRDIIVTVMEDGENGATVYSWRNKDEV